MAGCGVVLAGQVANHLQYVLPDLASLAYDRRVFFIGGWFGWDSSKNCYDNTWVVTLSMWGGGMLQDLLG